MQSVTGDSTIGFLPKTARYVQEEAARRARRARYRIKEAFVVRREPAFFPGAAIAPNGDILVAFGTTSDTLPGGKVLLVRSTDGGRSWAGPALVAVTECDPEGGSANNAVGLSAMPDGSVILPLTDALLRRRDGVSAEEKNPARIFDFALSARELRAFILRSPDSGHHWGKRQQIAATAYRAMTFGRVISLKDGSIMAPLYFVKNAGENFRSGFVLSRDGGETWSEPHTAAYMTVEEAIEKGFPQPPDGGTGWNETAFAQLANGDIIGIVRQDGDLGPRRQMFHVRSADGGQTWTRPKPTDGYGKMPDLTLSSSGELLMAMGSINLGDGSMVFTAAKELREKLGGTASFAGLLTSGDGGLTWREDARFESPIPEGVPFDAPSMVALPDGNLFVAFNAADETYTDPKGLGWDGGYFLVGNILEPIR